MKGIRSKAIVGVALLMTLGTVAGCGADSGNTNTTSEQSAVVETSETTEQDNSSDATPAGEMSYDELKAAYEELQVSYDELEDYSIYLEQQLAVMESEYAQIKGQLDLFSQNEGGSKVYLVDAYDGDDNESDAE